MNIHTQVTALTNRRGCCAPNPHQPHRAPLRHQLYELRHSRLPSQFPSSNTPFDTCVSYAPATTTRQIRHLSDTNCVFSATRVSNPPICVSTPTRPIFPPHATTKSANPLSLDQTAPGNSFVSYGPDTTMRQMRHPPDTKRIGSATKSVSCPYLSVSPTRPIFPLHIATKSANPAKLPRATHSSATAQIRPRY